MRSYFIYITTNPEKEVLYIGITNDLKRRLFEHQENKGNPETFAGKYYCYKLVYWERFVKAEDAIAREKQLKNWNRKKKEVLIQTLNPKWNFLNSEVFAEGAF
ncbi:MAG: GIY-YIG nuclease family protein [Bacteroidia bacterium]|nr:GIY-YIG nuclease family protein [Bacteroidia bacterium]